MLAVWIDHPQVVAPTPIADENDALAIGREPWLEVDRHPARDAGGTSTGDGKGVEIAQQIEDDRPAVGGDIDREPTPLARHEANRPCGNERELTHLRSGLNSREQCLPIPSRGDEHGSRDE